MIKRQQCVPNCSDCQLQSVQIGFCLPEELCPNWIRLPAAFIIVWLPAAVCPNLLNVPLTAFCCDQNLGEFSSGANPIKTYNFVQKNSLILKILSGIRVKNIYPLFERPGIQTAYP